jgi:hypothetical protein
MNLVGDPNEGRQPYETESLLSWDQRADLLKSPANKQAEGLPQNPMPLDSR